jgi:CheY-like chemotaxis protein
VTDKSLESTPLPDPKVLVADDDEIFLEILTDAVKDAGARAETARDGLEALQRLADSAFDILITDLNMPHMDGLALLREVRTQYPHMLCILITGFGSLESAIEALRLGVYDYIQKPFMTERVSVIIRNALERVKVFKENALLLEKIEILHKKLCLMEGKRYPAHEVYSSSGQLIKGPLFPDGTFLRQDAFLENPAGNPSRTLAALEILRSLRQDSIITDSELNRIRLAILKRTESDGS